MLLNNQSGYVKVLIVLSVVIILLLVILIVLVTPLGDLIFPEETTPTIDLEVAETMAMDSITGKYRTVVTAVVGGNPEPTVRFNRNDGIDVVGSSSTLILLSEGESFTLVAVAENEAGSNSASIELRAPEAEANGDLPDSSAAGSGTDNGEADSETEFGSISGELSYPSDHIPPLRVTAFHLEEDHAYYVDTEVNQPGYTIENLPVGTYHVIAYTDAGFAGAYSQYVLDGLRYGFDDHSLISVTVLSGQNTGDIDPADWYDPDPSYPPRP
jgi:hypothetical protein